MSNEVYEARCGCVRVSIKGVRDVSIGMRGRNEIMMSVLCKIITAGCEGGYEGCKARYECVREIWKVWRV